MLLNCGAGEDSWESLGLQGDQTSQSWRTSTVNIRKTDAEAPILWLPDIKSQFTGKDLDAGKVWGQEVKGVTEDKMVEWQHWLNGHKFEQTQIVKNESLECCSSWGCRESDATWQLNNMVFQMAKNLPTMPKTWVRKIPWRREWQPTPIFLPGEFHEQRSLMTCSPWGSKETRPSD